MKCLKKVLVSALISASLCSNITKAIPTAGLVGIVTAGLAVAGGTATAIGCACSKKNGNKESGANEQIIDSTSQLEDFYPTIFDYGGSTKEMLHDQLSGDGLKEFIAECGGDESFGVLRKFFNELYCHGHVDIPKDKFKDCGISMMSFETVVPGGRIIQEVSMENLDKFFSKNRNEKKINFALYAMARCMDPFFCSMTYKKLCKVVRKNYVGFEFRSDKDDLVSEDCICSVFVNKNNKNNIELRYQSDSRAFKCIFNLN